MRCCCCCRKGHGQTTRVYSYSQGDERIAWLASIRQSNHWKKWKCLPACLGQTHSHRRFPLVCLGSQTLKAHCSVCSCMRRLPSGSRGSAVQNPTGGQRMALTGRCLLLGFGIYTTDHTQQRTGSTPQTPRLTRNLPARRLWRLEKDNRSPEVAEAPRQRQRRRRRLHFGGLAILWPHCLRA